MTLGRLATKLFRRTRYGVHGALAFNASVAILCLGFAVDVRAQDSEAPIVNWHQGPATAPIGAHLAEITIDENHVYLNENDTQKFLELNENPVAGTELATIAPIKGNWFLLFEFDESGYVSDAEKGKLDPEQILESIREGTEAANEERRKRGWAEYTIVGWHEEPHYDEQTNNLSWATVGESGGTSNINRIVKILGRRGVMTATLVVSPDDLADGMSNADALLARYQYLPGNKYAEYVPGSDKLAEYGLTALVVGGAGAAAVKSGLLAKLWKPIAVGLVAVGAAIKRFLLGGRSTKHDPSKPIV